MPLKTGIFPSSQSEVACPKSVNFCKILLMRTLLIQFAAWRETVITVLSGKFVKT